MGKHKIEVIEVTKPNGDIFYHVRLNGACADVFMGKNDAMEAVLRLKNSIRKQGEKIIFSEEIEI